MIGFPNMEIIKKRQLANFKNSLKEPVAFYECVERFFIFFKSAFRGSNQCWAKEVEQETRPVSSVEKCLRAHSILQRSKRKKAGRCGSFKMQGFETRLSALLANKMCPAANLSTLANRKKQQEKKGFLT